MKILVVGGGGREHAIIWKLKQSPLVDKIYCAPGNAGISELAECVPIGVMEFNKLINFVKENDIDYTIIGMDDPLAGGIVDAFEIENLKVFGPRQNAAILESSKAFSKNLMKKYNIPTAAYETFNSYEEAKKYLEKQNMPIVLKADGLALGKGVLICKTMEEAQQGLKEMMQEHKFGSAGNTVVIEEFLEGPEVSVLSFCDGKTIIPMVSAQDHKRVYDNDEGLNTGGMGTFSPSKFYTKQMAEDCMKKIFQPTVDAMIKENRPFVGIIYFGLMYTKNGIKVIEYNARFGDPETQVILPRLKTDLLQIMLACTNGTLDKIDIEWYNNAAVCVMLASGGYPVSYDKGYEITGLEKISERENIIVFHSGTAKKDGKIVTSGGRVLGITGIGNTIDEAIQTAYEGVELVNFSKKHFRTDIGKKNYN
ncbi:phosphoribosylamine--glycine ligase [Clostridium sp. MD294]|uniref:phosphoribosylamine--glycine ligase n=1 Tax=Clostridium sp. MD294 TaxID=97138 RepID=UPI0002CA9584|nr:phosphoribosylamine--glycine ligase [Clostridium sp. MD294]NDO45679.1 phosphoribosylamine--glycine ligase [Clostridium sp. MD294]USF30668.1 Phosphoribosylamine--glycine ligase [Clostridium sp. MD294]